MKKAEIIIAIIAVIGLTLSLIGIPGGNILTILSISFLTIIYCYLGFALLNGIRFREMFKKQSYAGISALRITGAVGTGIVLSTALTGIMFKWMMWPGASVVLLVSVPGILVLLIIAFVKYSKNKDVFYKKLLLRLGIVGIVVLVLVVSPNMIRDAKYRNNPELLKAIRLVEQNPENEEYRQKVHEEFEKMRIAEQGR